MSATLVEPTAVSVQKVPSPRVMPAWKITVWYVAIAIAMPVLGRLFPGAMNGYHSLILMTGVTYAMIALPLNMLMGYAGQISLGHAAFLGIGAFASGIIAGRLGLPFLLGIVVAMIVGALAALIIGIPALRIRGLYLALVTLGFGLAMYAFVFRARAITAGFAGLTVPSPKIGNYVIDHTSPAMLSIVIMAFLGVWLLDRNLLRTKIGRAFLALRQDEDVSAAAGIDVPRYKLLAFALYGALSAAGGSILGHVNGFAQQETFVFDFSLFFVVIVLVGGARSRTGAAAAGFFFGASPRFFGFLKVSVFWIGPLLVLFTIVRHPGGLGQTLHDVRMLIRGKRAKRDAPPSAPDDAAPIASFMLPRPATAVAHVPGAPLHVENIVVRFGGLVAVNDVSFTVPDGKITGLIGPNGAGKTTLFNAISGLVQPDQGRVVLNGTDVSRLPAHRRARLGLGRTFQQIGLIKDVTVTENLLLAQHRLTEYGTLAALMHAPRAARGECELLERAHETLGLLGFERFAETPLGSLSHGQQRIVELGAALLTAPRVLLLDEPSAGMSPAAAEALAERLIQIRDELKQTIVLIEHHLPLVLATCDSVNVMDAGRLLTSGTPHEIRSDPAVISAYLGERPTR